MCKKTTKIASLKKLMYNKKLNKKYSKSCTRKKQPKFKQELT